MPVVSDFFSGAYASWNNGGSCVAECDGWQFDREAILTEIATCSTPGNNGTSQFPGRSRHSGTAKGLLRQGDEIENYFSEGSEINNARFYYGSGKFWGGTIIIGKVSIEEVDIPEGKPIRWSCDWKAQGLLTKGAD